MDEKIPALPERATMPADRRPLAPPAWVLPAATETSEPAAHDRAVPRPATPRATPVGFGEPDDIDTEEEDVALSGAGAFGPAAGRPGWRAFDPERRGVRALAVVAVVVIVIAAVLAWRARPRVDAVAPPAFDTAAATEQPAAAAVAGRPGAGSAAAEVVVAVGGKVRKPGLVRLPSGARVADALTAAGGADPGVDVAMLNLARRLVDGELILVGVSPSPGVAAATGPAATGAAPGAPVNLNTATLADLDALPGVGPVLAQRILDARDARGGFRSVGDLRTVDGIGDARFDQIKDLVTV